MVEWIFRFPFYLKNRADGWWAMGLGGGQWVWDRWNGTEMLVRMGGFWVLLNGFAMCGFGSWCRAILMMVGFQMWFEIK